MPPFDDWAEQGRANIALAVQSDPEHAAQVLQPLVAALADMRGASGDNRRAACELAAGLTPLALDEDQRWIVTDAHAAQCRTTRRAAADR